MKLSEFIVLNSSEKKNAVMHQGILVAKQKEPAQIRFLFQMDAFYVEMHCDYSSKQVSEYRTFTNPSHLHLYLDQIPLNGLM